MTALAPNKLAALIIQWVRDNSPSTGESPGEITVDTDLMAAGLIDSFGFVDLVLFIEGQYGIKINLADADPGDFTVVKGLCNIVLASYNGNHQEANDIAVINDWRQL